MRIQGSKLWEALFSVKNEYGEILLQLLVKSVSNTELQYAIEQRKASMLLRTLPPAKVTYADNCCLVDNFWTSNFPSLICSNSPAPLLELPNASAVRLFSAADNQDGVTDLFLRQQILPALKEGTVAIGLDCEWATKPAPDRSKDGKVCLVQLAIQNPEGL